MQYIKASKTIIIFFLSFLFSLTVLFPGPNVFAAAVAPKLFFSDMTDGPITGWEGSTAKGAAVTIWGNNVGSLRGNSTVTVCGITLNQDSDFAEWGVTTNPTTARGMQRITFYLNSQMQTGESTIKVNTSNGESQAIPFYCRNTGNIYFVSRDGKDEFGYGDSYAQTPNNGLHATQESGNNGPWFSTTKIRVTAKAGDVVYMRAGVYNERDTGNGSSSWANFNFNSANSFSNGENNNSIVVASYPGEMAQLGSDSRDVPMTLNGVVRTGTANVNNVHNININLGYSPSGGLSYWTWSKLKMRAGNVPDRGNNFSFASNAGYITGYNHIRIIGNDLQTLYGGGVSIAFEGGELGSHYNYIYGNYVHDISLDYAGQNWDGWTYDPDNPRGGRAYGLYLGGYGHTDYMYIGWNEWARIPYGRAIQNYGHEKGDYCDHLYIHDNYIHEVDLANIVLGGGDDTNIGYVVTDSNNTLNFKLDGGETKTIRITPTGKYFGGSSVATWSLRTKLKTLIDATFETTSTVSLVTSPSYHLTISVPDGHTIQYVDSESTGGMDLLDLAGDSPVAQTISGGARNRYWTYSKNTYIYNNILVNGGDASHSQDTSRSGPALQLGGVSWGAGMEHVYVFNNTMYHNHYDVLLGVSNNDSPDVRALATFKNNIFINDGKYSGFMLLGNGIDPVTSSDHDLYFGGAKNIPIWAENKLVVDPKLIDPSNGNFLLQSDSPAKGSGANLSSFFDNDLYLRTINYPFVWDVGASQDCVSTNATAPDIPTGLNVK